MNDLIAENEDDLQAYLLQTIKFPKKLHYLTAMLPKPNYNPLKLKLVDKYKYLQSLM
jgi:NIMA (never in mitosis gene a)-related kinase 1/4/5